MGLLFDDETHARIEARARDIRGRINRDEFRDECMSELWHLMSFDRSEMNASIERVYRRFTEEQDAEEEE